MDENHQHKQENNEDLNSKVDLKDNLDVQSNIKDNHGINQNKYDLVNIESEIYTNDHVSSLFTFIFTSLV